MTGRDDQAKSHIQKQKESGSNNITNQREYEMCWWKKGPVQNRHTRLYNQNHSIIRDKSTLQALIRDKKSLFGTVKTKCPQKSGVVISTNERRMRKVDPEKAI